MTEIINSLRGSGLYGINPASRLWKPLRIGKHVIQHRVALAPLTRVRCPNHVPTAMGQEYYAQRTDSNLLVTEATFIALEAAGMPSAPGIYNDDQITAWKKITNAVHAKGGIIYCQLWALGRANPGYEPDVKVVGPGTVPFEGGKVPEQMTIADIKRYLDHYRHAARCAMKAGFDGCEVHGAHGYLLDQFLQLSSNCTRDDEYSGSLENRSRFMLEAVAAVAEEIGQDKTAIRLSPFSTFQGMSQPVDEPFSTWGYVCESLAKAFPQLAYVSVTDARLGSDQGGSDATKKFTCDPFRAAFRGVTGPISQLSAEATTVFPDPTPEHPTVFFSAGGYTASEAETASERTGDVVAYGRIYLANPDLPHRLKSGLTLNAYDRSTFYTSEKEGYTTYPFASAETPKFVPN